MFTIFGASGNTGSIVARELLAKGEKVRVLARNPERVAELAALGAEVVVGDVTDRKSVSEALRGARGAYLLLPPDMATGDLFARNRLVTDNYVAGLREHGVAHAVLLSSVGAELPAGTGPIATVHAAEVALAKLPATKLTAVRAAYFAENILAYVHPIKQDGVLPVFGGGEAYPFPMVATRDIAHVAAEALLAPPAGSEIIELSGPKEYSFADAAKDATAILGRPVKAAPVPIDQLVPTLTGFGISAHFAGLVREMTEGFGKGAIKFEGTHRTVRGVVPLADVLRPALTG